MEQPRMTWAVWLIVGLAVGMTFAYLLLRIRASDPQARETGKRRIGSYLETIAGYTIFAALMMWAIVGLWQRIIRVSDAELMRPPLIQSTVASPTRTTMTPIAATETPSPAIRPAFESDPLTASAEPAVIATIDLAIASPTPVWMTESTNGSTGKNQGSETTYQPFEFSVGPGNTLRKVALKSYADTALWKHIAAANPELEPSPDKMIPVGTVLHVPAPPPDYFLTP